MTRRTPVPSFLLAAVFLTPNLVPAQTTAPTPPMGWNSWDAYGLTIDEADFRANATVLARLRAVRLEVRRHRRGLVHGQTPSPTSLETRKYLWNGNGLLIPAAEPLPLLGQRRGLQAAGRLGPRAGPQVRHSHRARHSPPGRRSTTCPSPAPHFHAADAADTTSPCPWDDGNWGVNDNAAGQAYYDSMLSSTPPGASTSSRSIASATIPTAPPRFARSPQAIRKTGRPIVLSLSPGPTAARTRSRSRRSTRRCGASPTTTGTCGPLEAQARRWRISLRHCATPSTASASGFPT